MSHRRRRILIVLEGAILSALFLYHDPALSIIPPEQMDPRHHVPIPGIYLWYEDEDLEDCGIAFMLKEPHAESCVDIMQIAQGPFPTLKACQDVAYDTQHIRASTEFDCDRERPIPINDDVPPPSSH